MNEPAAQRREDAEQAHVVEVLRRADPAGERLGRVLRATFDQLYDGQHTGRYSWAQLHKTERTHFGTLVEINIRREFDGVIGDGAVLDYAIDGIEIDCKYSQTFGGWMIPPEAFGRLLLVVHARDDAAEFAVGVVRASAEHLRTSRNRDGKTQLNPAGRDAVIWLQRPGALPPNALLAAQPDDVAAIFALGSGQRRVNELFRRLEGRRIGRNTIATVAQQDDYMKRVRSNGGARSALRHEGMLLLSGDYLAQRAIAGQLGLDAPRRGEIVSVFVTPADEDEPNIVFLEGRWWRRADPDVDPLVPAPTVPHG